MTRKELLNSPEYWQGIAENQCYNENIDYTLQLVDKKQTLKEVVKWLQENVDKYLKTTREATGYGNYYSPVCDNRMFGDLMKAMEK